jgi:hypothetical protein
MFDTIARARGFKWVYRYACPNFFQCCVVFGTFALAFFVVVVVVDHQLTRHTETESNS